MMAIVTGAFDLVLFDLGGVIGELDRDGMLKAASAAGVDPRPAMGLWRSAYEPGAQNDHVMHRAERGELAAAEFLALAEHLAPGASLLFDPAGPTGLARFFRPSIAWADLARQIKANGVRIGALTNTMFGFDGAAMIAHNPVMHSFASELFENDILESHLLGARKPDAAAFLAAVSYFEVEPTRILFIDDEATNCAGAIAVGLTAIHCSEGGALVAQQQVRDALGF